MSSCCTTDGSCHTGGDDRSTVYRVTGVDSAHCRGVVATALAALDGVVSAEVDPATGRLTVTTAGEPDDALIASAVDDAGYGFAGRG